MTFTSLRRFSGSFMLLTALAVAGCTKKTDMPEDRASSAPDTATLIKKNDTMAHAGADTGMDSSDHSMDAMLAELKAQRNDQGIVIVLPEKILFETGQDKLGPNAKQTLGKIDSLIVHYNAAPVVINGYTDNQGKPDANVTLSEKRATAVKDYLVGTLGLNAARIVQVKGMGEASPVAPNDTPDGQQQNRRVEVIIKTNKNA